MRRTMDGLRNRLRGLRMLRSDLLLIAVFGTVAIGFETATKLVVHLLDWLVHGRNQAFNVWIDTLLLFGVTATVVALRRVRELRGEVERRRHTEEAYRESETRYRRLIELAPDAILVQVGG